MIVNIDSLIMIIITKELPLSPSSGKPSPDNTCLPCFTLCQTNATTSLISGRTKFSSAHCRLDTCWKLRYIFYFSSFLWRLFYFKCFLRSCLASCGPARICRLLMTTTTTTPTEQAQATATITTTPAPQSPLCQAQNVTI